MQNDLHGLNERYAGGMRKRLFLLLVLLGVLSAGCMYSLRPFATDDCLDNTAPYIGQWIELDDESEWYFSEREHGITSLIYSEEGEPAQFEVRHYLLGKTHWIDLFPGKLEMPNGVQSGCYLPLHMLLRVKLGADTLQMWAVDLEYAMELLKTNPMIQYESVSDRTVLTSSSEEIESFLLEYGDDPALYEEEPFLLVRNPQK